MSHVTTQACSTAAYSKCTSLIHGNQHSMAGVTSLGLWVGASSEWPASPTSDEIDMRFRIASTLLSSFRYRNPHLRE